MNMVNVRLVGICLILSLSLKSTGLEYGTVKVTPTATDKSMAMTFIAAKINNPITYGRCLKREFCKAGITLRELGIPLSDFTGRITTIRKGYFGVIKRAMTVKAVTSIQCGESTTPCECEYQCDNDKPLLEINATRAMEELDQFLIDERITCEEEVVVHKIIRRLTGHYPVEIIHLLVNFVNYCDEEGNDCACKRRFCLMGQFMGIMNMAKIREFESVDGLKREEFQEYSTYISQGYASVKENEVIKCSETRHASSCTSCFQVEGCSSKMTRFLCQAE